MAMEFAINYDIPDRGWSTPDYVEEDTTEQLAQKLMRYKLTITEAYSDLNNKNYFKGYPAMHKLMYLRESLVGEGNIPGSTTIDQLEELIQCPDDSKTSIKVNNLNNAMNFLFINCLDTCDPSQLDIELLTPEFIQVIHKLVVVDLVESSGVYRVKDSAPSNERWTYLPPGEISNCLENLCQFVRDEIRKQQFGPPLLKNCIVNRVKIVTTFLTNFLHIHPFTNGNGRTARLLISWLMSDIFFVPVPLFSSLTSRQTYLDCLRDSRHSKPFKPRKLSRLILDSVFHTHRLVCISLDFNL